jgi:hypothetical protein
VRTILRNYAAVHAQASSICNTFCPLQPVSYMSLGLTVGTGAGLLWWYNHEKDKKLEDISREGKSSVVVGQVGMDAWRLCPWA